MLNSGTFSLEKPMYESVVVLSLLIIDKVREVSIDSCECVISLLSFFLPPPPPFSDSRCRDVRKVHKSITRARSIFVSSKRL